MLKDVPLVCRVPLLLSAGKASSDCQWPEAVRILVWQSCMGPSYGTHSHRGGLSDLRSLPVLGRTLLGNHATSSLGSPLPPLLGRSTLRLFLLLVLRQHLHGLHGTLCRDFHDLPGISGGDHSRGRDWRT